MAWSRYTWARREGGTSCGGFVGQDLHLLLQLFNPSLSSDGGVMPDMRHVGAAFLAVRPEYGVDGQLRWRRRLEDSSDGCGGHPRANSRTEKGGI